MSADKIPAEVEATGLMRRVQQNGGFATILNRGDPSSGSLLLVVTSRGRHEACLERALQFDGGYHWQRCGPAESAGSADVADFLAKRVRFDPDSWVIELDVAVPERFIAETTSSG